MANKKRIKINEVQLKQIVTNSVKRILNEINIPKKRTFRFDDTPQGNYDKMVRYESMIGTLDDIINKMIKLSGKSSTMDQQDSIDTKVWNLAHEIKNLIERYGLDSNGFNADDYYPGDEFYPELQMNENVNGLENNKYYQDALEAIEMSDCGITFDEWYPAFQDELDPEEAEEIFKAALKSYPIPW